MGLQLLPHLLMNFFLHLHTVDILNIILCMKELGANKIFFYKMTAMRTNIIFSDISFDIFKELSGGVWFRKRV